MDYTVSPNIINIKNSNLNYNKINLQNINTSTHFNGHYIGKSINGIV